MTNKSFGKYYLKPTCTLIKNILEIFILEFRVTSQKQPAIKYCKPLSLQNVRLRKQVLLLRKEKDPQQHLNFV